MWPPWFLGCSIFPNILVIYQILFLTLFQNFKKHRSSTVATLKTREIVQRDHWWLGMIWDVVDCHSKLLYSGACSTHISAEGVAHLFLDTVWRYEGLPWQVISDWGPQFAAAFTKELNRLLRIKGLLSTTYHPQSDGQTEHVNQEMEIYPSIFISHHQNDCL